MNPGGGDLRFLVQAEGDGPKLGPIRGTVPGGAAIEIGAEAVSTSHGFAGFPGSTPGSVGIGAIFGRSDTGRVHVALAAAAPGWVPLLAPSFGGATTADASLRLENAVDGRTRGELLLEQTAVAGAGLGSSDAGGSAVSVLHRIRRAHSVSMAARALGGRGGSAFREAAGGADGGEGLALAAAGNPSGASTATGAAWGGQGGSSDQAGDAGAGGTARVIVSAWSRGNGHPVTVGSEPPPAATNPGFGWRPAIPFSAEPDPEPSRADTVEFTQSPLFPRQIWIPDAWGARGGEGGGLQALNGSRAGDGGAAESHSLGRAWGDSTATVHDRAVGGDAGTVSAFSGFPFGGSPSGPVRGGRGGRAESHADAIGGGRSAVSAFSYAAGGSASPVITSPFAITVPPQLFAGRGGDAAAHARARGLGAVHAEARAIGGAGDRGHGSGGARAVAQAWGRAGSVVAEATTEVMKRGRVGASAWAPVVGGRSETEARANWRALDRSVMERDAFATEEVAPDSAAVAAELATHPRVAEALASLGKVDPLAIALLGADPHPSDDGAGAAETYAAELSLSLEASFLHDGDRLLVGFLGVEGAGAGRFDSLRVRIERNGETAAAWEFEDLETARGELADLPLTLEDLLAGLEPSGPAPSLPGPAPGPGMMPLSPFELAVTFEWGLEGREGPPLAGRVFVALAPVPEPGTLLLLVVGLVGLLVARGRGCARHACG